jgi:hypothetical protein
MIRTFELMHGASLGVSKEKTKRAHFSRWRSSLPACMGLSIQKIPLTEEKIAPSPDYGIVGP